jgi:methionyl aminopeptidase
MSNISIKTADDIAKLKEGGRILARIMEGLCRAVMPGMSTMQLEELARKLIEEYQVKPSFLGFGDPPYPCALCASVNDEVVHSIPVKEKILKKGDIIGLDLGIWFEGLCTDMARTVAVGEISKQANKLIEVTRESLAIAERTVKAGATVGDIGFAVQSYVEENGFSVVRSLVGHGVGYKVHEPPQIPNYGRKGQGLVLSEGMVIAIEPMVNIGRHEVEVGDNGWDIVTLDKQLSAHFEDTLAVTKDGCIVLTAI